LNITIGDQDTETDLENEESESDDDKEEENENIFRSQCDVRNWLRKHGKSKFLPLNYK
jgi:hypothetical protein